MQDISPEIAALPMICMSILTPASYYLDYCHFPLTFEIAKYESSFKIVFVSLESLNFHM